MDELPGILLIGAGVGAIIFVGLLARLLLRHAREYLRKRNAVRRSAPSEIAGALTEAGQPLAECTTLLVQLGIKRELLNDRRATSLVSMAKVFDQSIFALYENNEALIAKHRQLKRESEAVYIHRRTQNLEQLSAQSKNLIFRALQLKREMSELLSELLARISAVPRNVAAESRQINAELDAALAGPIDVLRVKHGVHGKRMNRALYRVTRAREIYATLPAQFWNSEAELSTAELLPQDVDAADVVNRYYGKYARTAIQHMSEWLAGVRAVDTRHVSAQTAYQNALTSVTAALEQHPDQAIADEWARLPAQLDTIAHNLSHIELETLDTLTQQAHSCEARITAIREQATAVSQTAAAAQQIHTTAAFRDEQWRDTASHTARRLKEFEPGNFSPKINVAMLPAHIEALHTDWRTIVGGKIGSWEDWRRLAPTIRRFSDLNASLTKRLDLASHELERVGAQMRNMDVRLGYCIDGLQALTAHPDDRRAFSTLRKQALALRDRLQRTHQGRGLVDGVAKQVADFETLVRSALQDVCQRRMDECQKHSAALSEHLNLLTKHAVLNFDESLAKARSTQSVFHSLTLSGSEEIASLAGDATVLSQMASDLASQSRAIGQWVHQIEQALTQIERCASESTTLKEQRSRLAATLLSWVDYSRQDMVLADLRQRCTQTATNRRASTSLELAESRLSQELAAHQDQLDETREQMELFTRVQNLQRTAAAKYDALSDVLGGTSPELLRLLDHRNPGPFARMDAADAEIHFVEVIAEIDSELNRHSAKPPANTPVATYAALQQTLTQLQWKCEGGISDGMPLRDMHGEVLNAKQALARDRHKSKNSALPHVRRVKSLWLQAKKALAELSDPHIRTQRQQQLDAMRDLINQALRSAGADASEYS